MNPNEVDSQIEVIANQICNTKLSGVAIGIVVGDRQRMFFSGYADEAAETEISPDTLFEIGSITKVFTALLLAKFVLDRRLSLDEPVEPVLPENVSLPHDGETEITYRLLANHRSSLPRLPANLFEHGKQEDNPYVDYQIEHLYEYLNSLKNVPKIGQSEGYSNLGYGLLGHVLGRLDRTDYADAVTKHVVDPLELDDTAIELTEEQQARLANAHGTKNQPTKHWGFTDATVAAGGIRSTLSDMLAFLKFNLRPDTSPLAEAIKLTHQPAPSKDDSVQKKTPIRFPWFLATLLAVGSIGVQSQLNIGPGSFLFFVLVLLPVAISSSWLGLARGIYTLLLTTLMTWLLWQSDFGWLTTLLVGGYLAYVASFAQHWFCLRRWYVNQLFGRGRLGWQEMGIGDQEVLWHNGMVGGSASFIGFIPELDCGVVVLSNTAHDVDEIGIEVLELLQSERTTCSPAR